MGSYSKSEYHKNCMSLKETKELGTSSRPVSLWSPIPPETFYYDCFFYRQYPERELEYKDIEEKYNAIKGQKLDYSLAVPHQADTEYAGVGSAQSGIVTGTASNVYRSTSEFGQQRPQLNSSTGPGTFKAFRTPLPVDHLRTDPSCYVDATEKGKSSGGIVNSDPVRVGEHPDQGPEDADFTRNRKPHGCSELDDIRALLEESDRETMNILQEMLTTLRELSLRDTPGVTDGKQQSLKDTMKIANEDEPRMVALNAPGTKTSVKAGGSSPMVTWGDSEFEEFIKASSAVSLETGPEVQPLKSVSAPSQISNPVQPKSGRFKNASDPMDLEQLPPPAISKTKPNQLEPGTNFELRNGGTRLTAPELFGLSSLIADAIVFEMCDELTRDGKIPSRRACKLPAESLMVEDSAISSSHQKFDLPKPLPPNADRHISENIWDLVLNDDGQPAVPQEDEPTSKSDLNEPPAIESSAGLRRSGGVKKYALLAVPICVMLLGGIYALTRYTSHVA